MSLQIEFVYACSWTALLFGIGIALRELARETFDAWLGRAFVLMSVVIMSLFGWHATQECSALIATRQTTPAIGIDKPPSETEYHVTMSTGTQIQWRKYNVATNAATAIIGPMSGTAERGSSIRDRSDGRSAIICRPGGSVDCLRGGTFWSDATDGTASPAGETF